MEWIGRMNAAVAYIEANLDGEIDMKEVGRLASCSVYHFQRVFSYMANVTLAEYIRRRRLTRAAFDLQGGAEKVIDIALKYGYDSPTAFNRAFQQLHGMPPSEARADGKSFVAYPPLSFQITIQGVTAMNYRIEQKDAFRVVGMKLATTSENDLSAQEIPAFWEKVAKEGTIPRVCALMDGEPTGLMGICVGSWSQESTFDYLIAATSSKPAPEGMEAYAVPAATWAIFECTGPMPLAMQDMQRRVMTEWLPTSGYEYANAPDIELYSDGDNSKADYKSWIWLPIVKK